MIVIIDYGLGNSGSILNMLKKVGTPAKLSKNPQDVLKAEMLILPGVGAFDNAMINLNELNLLHVLNKRVLIDKTPILGICLGLQLFAKKSEEGKLPGLGWLDAETVKFKLQSDSHMKIPHMGWNKVQIKKENFLFDEMSQESRFYFVHSYHLQCNDTKDILSTTFYGYNFVSSVQRDNIMGVQFHPEKSHKFGFQLFRNFVRL